MAQVAELQLNKVSETHQEFRGAFGSRRKNAPVCSFSWQKK